MEFSKLLKKIISMEKYPSIKKITEEEFELIQLFWRSIRDNDNDLTKEIEDYLINNDREDLIKTFKDLAIKHNKEYYYFEYFRNKDIEEFKKEYLLNSIFKEYILIDKRTLEKFIDKKLTFKEIMNITKWIERIVYFCIENNYDGSKVVEILNENYKIDPQILAQFEALYNENIMTLKTNYIIRKLNDLE